MDFSGWRGVDPGEDGFESLVTARITRAGGREQLGAEGGTARRAGGCGGGEGNQGDFHRCLSKSCGRVWHFPFCRYALG